jgi:diguanylate cyclase (GGDEF)-like protein
MEDLSRDLPTPFAYNPENMHELSGLPNRAALNEALGNAVADPRLIGNFGLIFVDLDGVKQLNDTEGHDAGDDYLLYTAGVLRDATRPNDLITLATHLAGDEFVLLVSDINNQDDLDSIQDRLQVQLEDLGVPCAMGGKIHEPGETPSDLLGEADKRMYADKISRKIAPLSAAQRAAYLQMGHIAATYELSLRDASAIVEELSDKDL